MAAKRKSTRRSSTTVGRMSSFELERLKKEATAELRRAAKEKPHGLGFNGHARKCDCASCARARVKAIADYVRNPKVAEPKTKDSTVLVHSHFRRHPGHLKKMPRTRRILKAMLAQWDGRTR